MSRTLAPRRITARATARRVTAPRVIAGTALALAALIGAACSDRQPAGPERPADVSVTRVVKGVTYQIRYDGRTASVFANGKPALRVRYDGELRHVTAFLPDGRTIERTFTRRELAAAARPALDVSGSDGSTTPVARDNADCLKEWVAYAGASLVAVVTCAETGPTPLCAAALATAANALEAAIKCETAKS